MAFWTAISRNYAMGGYFQVFQSRDCGQLVRVPITSGRITPTLEPFLVQSELEWILKLPNPLWTDWSFSALLNFQVKSFGTITEPGSPPQPIETYRCHNQNIFKQKKILTCVLQALRDSCERGLIPQGSFSVVNPIPVGLTEKPLDWRGCMKRSDLQRS